MSMKIISPELMWIDGRCYRINPERIIETVGPDVLEMNDSYEIGIGITRIMKLGYLFWIFNF